MAGLAAARVLKDHYARVTVIERNALSAETSLVARKGLPQANHAHVLLPGGYRVLAAGFPGLIDDLVAAGAWHGDAGVDTIAYGLGTWMLRRPLNIPCLLAPRPYLDAMLVKHLRRLPAVSFLDEHDVIEPVHDDRCSRVTGVIVRSKQSGERSTVEADLVVDATGRGSLSPTWLEQWGYGMVTETHVKCPVGYASAYFERRADDCQGAHAAVVMSDIPPAPSEAGVMLSAGPDRWIVGLHCRLKGYPTTDLEAFRDFARRLPVSEIYDVVKDRAPLGEIASYRFSSSRRRHFERKRRFPDSYLVLGDALCSSNPAYGQGMTVALLESEQLDKCLHEGDRRLAQRFFARAERVTSIPWNIARLEDLRLPEVQGKRPAGFELARRYKEAVQRATGHDPVVCRRFVEVVGLLRHPASMCAPHVMLRVGLSELRGSGAKRGV